MHRGQLVGNGLHSRPDAQPPTMPIDLTLSNYAQLSLGDLRGVSPTKTSCLPAIALGLRSL